MGCLDGGSHGSSSWPPFSVWKWGRRWPRWRGRLKSTRMCFTAGGGSSAKGQTQGVVERKTTMPILSSLLCEAKGNRLTITATCLELGIRTHWVRSQGAERGLRHHPNAFRGAGGDGGTKARSP